MEGGRKTRRGKGEVIREKKNKLTGDCCFFHRGHFVTDLVIDDDMRVCRHDVNGEAVGSD